MPRCAIESVAGSSVKFFSWNSIRLIFKHDRFIFSQYELFVCSRLNTKLDIDKKCSNTKVQIQPLYTRPEPHAPEPTNVWPVAFVPQTIENYRTWVYKKPATDPLHHANYKPEENILLEPLWQPARCDYPNRLERQRYKQAVECDNWVEERRASGLPDDLFPPEHAYWRSCVRLSLNLLNPADRRAECRLLLPNSYNMSCRASGSTLTRILRDYRSAVFAGSSGRPSFGVAGARRSGRYKTLPCAGSIKLPVPEPAPTQAPNFISSSNLWNGYCFFLWTDLSKFSEPCCDISRTKKI